MIKAKETNTNMKTKTNYRIMIPIFIFCIISVVSIGFITKNSVQYSDGWLLFPIKQSIGFIVGFFIIYIIPKADLTKMKRLIDVAYFILLGMSFILISGIPGITKFFVKSINGARGWFQIFPGGPTIQPVEFMKIAMILQLAFISHRHLTNSDSTDRELLIKYALYGLIPIFLIVQQPDLGGAILLGIPWLFMLLVSIKSKSLVRTFTLFLIALILLFTTFLILPQGQEFLINFTPIKAYQLERLNAWLQPFDSTTGLQLQQSLILMGSAGKIGHGVLYNDISMPEPHTDMIFAQTVGMYGFIIGFIIIILFYWMVLEMLSLAKRVKEPLYKLTAVGIAALFIIQVTENIGMIIGLLPITGIVLPFISYGVSALISYSIIIGVILNINNRIKSEE